LTLLYLIESIVNLHEITFAINAEQQYPDKETHFLPFLAVLADSLKSCAEGAPLLPTLRIFSPEPAAIRLRFWAML
jgi:hypothetical protein